ncbi:MAG: phosphate signaling complex protein PhoU [Geminicoccaceae bacterium]
MTGSDDDKQAENGSGRPGRHVVRSFDQDLNQLNDLIVRMGGLVELQVANAARALIERDEALAREVREQDAEVDAFEEQIDQLAIRLLATRQPMAVDLRIITMSLKLSNDLERIGDYAKSIAKRAMRLAGHAPLKPMVIIPSMAEMVQGMVKDVLDAFVDRNSDKAMRVWRRDSQVDEFYDSLFRELITFILEDPRNTSTCIDLLFIAKNLERIGDHTTNIAEKIHYMVHGTQINWTRTEDT